MARELSREGLITTRVEPGRRGPERHVHRLTDAGWRELRDWLRRPVEPGARHVHGEESA